MGGGLLLVNEEGRLHNHRLVAESKAMSFPGSKAQGPSGGAGLPQRETVHCAGWARQPG